MRLCYFLHIWVVLVWNSGILCNKAVNAFNRNAISRSRLYRHRVTELQTDRFPNPELLFFIHFLLTKSYKWRGK